MESDGWCVSVVLKCWKRMVVVNRFFFGGIGRGKRVGGFFCEGGGGRKGDEEGWGRGRKARRRRWKGGNERSLFRSHISNLNPLSSLPPSLPLSFFLTKNSQIKLKQRIAKGPTVRIGPLIHPPFLNIYPPPTPFFFIIHHHHHKTRERRKT